MHALTDLAAIDFAAAGSPEGRAWMAALPSLLHDLARQWNLITTGDLFWHGYNAVVFPVRQGIRPLALKLAWPVAELLWTRADELPDSQAITGLLGIIVENGQLDQAKATAWGFVRSIDYRLSASTCPEPRIEHGRLTQGQTVLIETRADRTLAKPGLRDQAQTVVMAYEIGLMRTRSARQ